MGWQLSGLSSINRCPTSKSRDGIIDGVDFDSNDKFCLDGQRLVDVGGGEYRTEIDGFAHITGGLSGFTVTTASGLIMEYGRSTNSRIKAQGRSDILTRALEEVRDSFGNKYTINYENYGYANGEYRPKYINMSNDVVILSHVEFGYESRSDILEGYISGSKYSTSKRLNSITTHTKDEGEVKQHLLKYEYDLSTNNSILMSLKECSQSNQCVQPISFEWSLSEPGFASVAENTNINNSGWQYKPNVADVNGDGRSDLICSSLDLI